MGKKSHDPCQSLRASKKKQVKCNEKLMNDQRTFVNCAQIFTYYFGLILLLYIGYV
jgi:hypothetical protein